MGPGLSTQRPVAPTPPWAQKRPVSTDAQALAAAVQAESAEQEVLHATTDHAPDDTQAHALSDTGNARVADVPWVQAGAMTEVSLVQTWLSSPLSYLGGASAAVAPHLGLANVASVAGVASIEDALVSIGSVSEGERDDGGEAAEPTVQSLGLQFEGVADNAAQNHVSTGEIASHSVVSHVFSQAVARTPLSIDGVVDNDGVMRIMYGNGAALGDATPVITGTVAPHVRLVVFNAAGDVLGLTESDASGRWSFELSQLSAGQHNIRVQSVSTDREEATISFEVSDFSGAFVNTASNFSYLATGWEDTAYVFGRADLDGIVQATGIASNAALVRHITINSLPADGVLQILENNAWRTAVAGERVARTDIEAGRLRFAPDANESGSGFFNAPGVGNGRNVYASLDVEVSVISPGVNTADATVQMVINPLSASLGAGTSVSRSVTTHQTVATHTTMYRTILDDTRVSSDSVGHDWRLRYKLSNGQEGDIDINDSKGWTDGTDRVVYQGNQLVGVTDLMLYQSGKSSLWLSQKNGAFNYTNVSNIGLEDCYGIFGWGWFADWNDGYVSVRVESFQQQTGTTQRATTTTVVDTQFDVQVSNAAEYARTHPNACFNITLSGGSNYQLRDAAGNVLMTGAGSYQATAAQVNAGLKVHVFSGGSAPSVDSTFVSTTSPLVIDLNGDGVFTTTVDDGVAFDIDASGHAKQVAWVGAHDGLLVLDINGNGRIDDGRELFGNHTHLAQGGLAADGWQALAQHDSNGDGAITGLDAVFGRLQVWVDANQNGVTDAGELHSLLSLGITAIALQHDGSQTLQNGNVLSGLAHVSTDSGAQLLMTDAWLQTRVLDDALAVQAHVVI